MITTCKECGAKCTDGVPEYDLNTSQKLVCAQYHISQLANDIASMVQQKLEEDDVKQS